MPIMERCHEMEMKSALTEQKVEILSEKMTGIYEEIKEIKRDINKGFKIGLGVIGLLMLFGDKAAPLILKLLSTALGL